MYYIYRIFNMENGKTYIGMTKNPKKRFCSHLSRLKIGKHSSRTFQKDFNLYGKSVFSFSVIASHVDKDEAHLIECKEIEKAKSFVSEHGYNEGDPRFWTWQGQFSRMIGFNEQSFIDASNSTYFKLLSELGYPLKKNHGRFYFYRKTMD